MVLTQGEEPKVITVGDDELNQKAVAYTKSMLREDESLVAVSGFSFGEKVLAITDQRILVAEQEESISRLVLNLDHDAILRLDRDSRTLIIQSRIAGERRYKFAEEQTVSALVRMARNYQTAETQVEDEGKSSIADKVRFWEEQDKINQELIPRVIRQNELLTKHIAEHDSLPEVAGKAISEALAGAREKQRQQYEAALDAAKRELGEQAQAIEEEQRRQFGEVLDVAKTEIAEQSQAIKEEQRQQYDAALDAAVKQLAQQGQTQLDQTLAALRQEIQKTRRILVGLAFVAVAVSVAALVLVLLA